MKWLLLLFRRRKRLYIVWWCHWVPVGICDGLRILTVERGYTLYDEATSPEQACAMHQSDNPDDRITLVSWTE